MELGVDVEVEDPSVLVLVVLEVVVVVVLGVLDEVEEAGVDVTVVAGVLDAWPCEDEPVDEPLVEGVEDAVVDVDVVVVLVAVTSDVAGVDEADPDDVVTVVDASDEVVDESDVDVDEDDVLDVLVSVDVFDVVVDGVEDVTGAVYAEEDDGVTEQIPCVVSIAPFATWRQYGMPVASS